MADNNVIKFRPGPKKKPEASRPAGAPSLPVAIGVAVVTGLIVLAISWWFGR